MSKEKTDRYNKGKMMYGLIPWQWLESLANIFTFGAKKYAPNNWKKSLNTEDHNVLIEDRISSLLRHYVSWRKGEIDDPESGEHHLAHVAWNALMIVWYDKNSNLVICDKQVSTVKSLNKKISSEDVSDEDINKMFEEVRF